MIEGDDDRVLALPWELIRLDDRFVVRDGRLDVARSVPVSVAPVLSPPAAPLSLLVNVSAPQRSGLDYERESYVIIRALHEHLGVMINEMGELDDLVDGLRGEPPPLGVHVSGHGGPGTLLFEDEYGEDRVVDVEELLTAIRQRAPERLPRFFFLACCHGGDAPQTGGDLAATATALHADGIAQLVGSTSGWCATNCRPVPSALLCRAGARSADARCRPCRPMEMSAAPPARGVLRDAGAPLPSGAFAYGWAQMGLYQRGPDYPLGTAIAAGASVAIETTERRMLAAYPGSRSQVLKTGFVGRRQEMHALAP